MNQQLSDNEFKTKYAQIKFKYLCLKLQNGGYTEVSPTHLAAAAIAVINCTYAGTNQQSVDCVAPISTNIERINQLNTELLALGENPSGIKNINRKREITVELNRLKTLKTEVKAVDVNNRTCDNVLATVASIYLSIVFNTNETKSTFITLINDLINAKIRNCSEAQRTDEKKQKIIEYFLNTITKLNQYLSAISDIDNTSTNTSVSYKDIFTNAEYGKQDKKAIEALREKGLVISKEDEENFRMVNDFIGSKLDKVKLINIQEVINGFKISGKSITNDLKTKLNKFDSVSTDINTDKFIAFGVYTFDRANNKSIITNTITNKQRKERGL